MVQGLIHCGRIWAINYQDDDAAGGAVISGTVAYDMIPCRVQSQPTEQVLHQQGLEVPTMYSAMTIPVTLDIEERYEFEFLQPSNHPFANKRYRIIDVHPADFSPSDPRNYMLLTMKRITKAHDLQ